VISSNTVSKPLRALGDFFALALDTLIAIARPPFAWRESLPQRWFVARVSLLPTILLAIPFTVLSVFTTSGAERRPAAGEVGGAELDPQSVGDARRPASAQAKYPTGLQKPLTSAFIAARQGASHVGTIPRRSAGTTGRGVQLFAAVLRYTVTDAISLRLPLGDLLTQAWTLLKVTAAPGLLMAIPFGAMVTVVTSGLVNQVGATSLLGAAAGVGVVRQGAPITAGLLMGGAAASAIASDFGARAVREELDAMRVIGVDPVRRLVVPRFLALLLLAPILCLFIVAAGSGAAFILAVSASDLSPGSFWQSFGTFAKVVDVWFAIGKTIVFGAIVAIVSSLRGMEAKGGPRGVADAVNSSVVLNVVGIVFANLAITQLQTMFYPLEIA
jgi:phospholipid/cholesterol/gamma-HCH transport system permease protein